MNIILSPSITEGDRISYLFCIENDWIAISEKDKNDFYSYEEYKESVNVEFGVITEEELFVRVPFLRGKMMKEEEKFITIDYENGKVYINPKHNLKSIFTDHSARATNQSNFTADEWTYIKSRKRYYIKLSLIALLILICSLFISWGLFILLFYFLFLSYFNIITILDLYNIGTLNATKVVTLRPTRIAVLTDLSKGFGKYPLVKICKIDLPKNYSKINERIPSSCGYQNHYNQNFWDRVIPNPIVFATNDKKTIEAKLKEIPSQDWIDLNQWLNLNKNNLYEGYYPILKGNHNWSEEEKPKFVSFFQEKRPEHNT